MKKIFLILGDACNMQCKYCKAHLGDNERVGIKYPTNEVMQYLKKTIKTEDTLINFYGGEPLLYFDVIKYVIDTLAIPVGGVIWSTMTNGKGLTKEMVKYFNDNKVVVNLSWDGDCTKISRGYDVLENPTLRKNILEINDLWINSTLTSLNSPLQIAKSHEVFLKEYQAKHGYSYGIHIGLATPTSENDSLYVYNYKEIYSEMRYMLRSFLTNDIDLSIDKLMPSDCIVRTVLFSLKKKASGLRDICLDMDLDGNFFACPFSRKTVDTLDTLDEYIRKATVLAEVRKCKEGCPLVNICDGGCPHLKGTKLGKEGCTLRKAYYTPFFELFTGQLLKE